ncbi:hypothetical protein [Paenibacillus jamilae]|nr:MULTISPECIES: hypothetical protein [Paenibacillus]
MFIATLIPSPASATMNRKHISYDGSGEQQEPTAAAVGRVNQ